MRTARSSISLVAILGCLTVPLPTSSGLPSSRPAEPVERGRYLMGTLCHIRAFGDSERVGPALDAALDRIEELELVMTTFRSDGELARLNAAFSTRPTDSPVEISSELFRALDQALSWARKTDGRFDPTTGALTAAWDLTAKGRRPSSQELDEARARTSWRLVSMDAQRLTATSHRTGVTLDLGGIGKGYALDAAAEVLRRRNVDAALLNFGGQVLALGAPPGESGWIVDIADPRDRARPVLSLRVRDASLSTSGNSERSIRIAGQSYGHLIDPRTGRPSRVEGSMTVVADLATAADALSTALALSDAAERVRILPPGAGFLSLEPGSDGDGSLIADATPDLYEFVLESSAVRWLDRHSFDPSRRAVE